MPTINRRSALMMVSAAPVGLTALKAEQAQSQTSDTPFLHGIASGDPRQDSVVIWSRLTLSPLLEADVTWEVATKRDFKKIIATGMIKALAKNDYTLKVVVSGLKAGKTYFYRFNYQDKKTDIGRTRTLPKKKCDSLGIALVSCSNYAFGYFNAYDAIAKDESIDLVLHTGDYIYEYGQEGWGKETAQVLNRQHLPANEIISLSDYRIRHAQYKTDAGSKAMHAAHPFVCCWDDHESANNPWVGGAQNHDPKTEGDWVVRRQAATQAYYEWMPIRDPEQGQSALEFWRTYRFGNLASLITLESRHTARGLQVDYKDYLGKLKTKEDRDAFMKDVIGDPSRKMLSDKMLDLVSTSLKASKAEAQPWRIIGNAIPMARMLAPNIVDYGIDPAKQKGFGTKDHVPYLAMVGKLNLPFYSDTWDGYPVARQDFYARCQAQGAQDLIVLTGDSHSFWGNELSDDHGKPMGVELGTAGVTSPGDFVESGWDLKTAEELDRVFEKALDEVVYTDNLHQGYVRLLLTPTKARADFMAVDTVLSTNYRLKLLKSFELLRKDGSLRLNEIKA